MDAGYENVRGTCEVRKRFVPNTEYVKAVKSVGEPSRKQLETRVPMMARIMGLESDELLA